MSLYTIVDGLQPGESVEWCAPGMQPHSLDARALLLEIERLKCVDVLSRPLQCANPNGTSAYTGNPAVLHGVYHRLATILIGDETLTLSDGRVVGKQALYEEELRHNPTNSCSLFNLASILAPSDTVVLDDGRVLGKKELYVETLRYDPGDVAAYHNLALLVKSPREGAAAPTVAMADGRGLTRPQLFMHAVMSCGTRVSRNELMKRIPAADRSACRWSIGCHAAFGPATNKLMGALLLALRQHERCNNVVSMDPALLEEMLSYWSLQDSLDPPHAAPMLGTPHTREHGATCQLM